MVKKTGLRRLARVVSWAVAPQKEGLVPGRPHISGFEMTACAAAGWGQSSSDGPVCCALLFSMQGRSSKPMKE